MRNSRTCGWRPRHGAKGEKDHAAQEALAGTPRGWRLTTHKAKVGTAGASATVYVVCAS